MRTRSPRTVQHRHPLFISTICSSLSFTRMSLSMPVSPNSFSITAIFSPCCSVRMRLRSVVFPGAEEAGEDGDGDEVFFGGGLHGQLGRDVGVNESKIWATSAFFKVAGDEDQAGPAVIVGPSGAASPEDTACAAPRGRRAGRGSPATLTRPFRRRMRSPRSSSSVSRAVARASQSTGGSGGPGEGADARVVAAARRGARASARRRRRASPRASGRRAVAAVQAGVEEPRRVERRPARRAAIAAPGLSAARRASSASTRRRRRQVGLGDHEAVGDRDLLHRLRDARRASRAPCSRVDRRSPRPRARSARPRAASRPAWRAAARDRRGPWSR